MAKKRILKKEIYYIFGDMLFDVLISQHLAPKINESKVESIISRINQSCSEFISRAQHTPNKENKQIVKQYYKKLIQDFDHEIELISLEIESLNSSPDKQ